MAYKKIKKWHIPAWDAEISPLYGDFRGKLAVINSDGTVSLRGNSVKAASNVSKFQTESDDKGPGISLTAKGSLF